MPFDGLLISLSVLSVSFFDVGFQCEIASVRSTDWSASMLLYTGFFFKKSYINRSASQYFRNFASYLESYHRMMER